MIFTTLADGSLVNANIYLAKEDVYLDGGPGLNAPASTAGLPEGDYYFQVTDPSGRDLLSSDHISCRKLHVDETGVFSQVHRGTNYMWRSAGWAEVECQHRAGIDLQYGEHGALSVRLFPYDHTPDSAGMYKVWLTPVGQWRGDATFVPHDREDAPNGEHWQPNDVHGFVPAHSWTESFAVKHEDRRPAQRLSLHTFHDTNVNGAWDGDEHEITGIELVINDPLGAGNRRTSPIDIVVEAGRWGVRELAGEDALTTAVFLDGRQLSLGPDVDPLVWVDVLGVSGERHELVYGDVGVGTIAACTFYDADGDGEVDGDEVGIRGWQVQIEGIDIRNQIYGPVTQSSEADGCTRFAGLFPGRYTVRELGVAGRWVSSGPDVQTFDIRSELDDAELSGTTFAATFTNYCHKSVAFGGTRHWRSSAGLHEMQDASIEYLNTLSPFKSASNYFADGDEPFDGKPQNRSPRAEISQFLADGGRANKRRELAQQLLAFVLNIHERVVDLGAGVRLPDGSFSTADELISAAIAAWERGSTRSRAEHAARLAALNDSTAIEIIYEHPCVLP